MNEVLKPILGKCAVVYLDDIIIFSSDRKQHARNLQQVIELISKACLQIKLRKCKFFQKSLKFLGHEISEEEIRTDPDKVAVMKELQPPADVKGVQSLLGFFNYYRKFVPGFSKITRPIYKLLGKDTPWNWGPEQDHALDLLKEAMSTAPVLTHPDFTRPFVIYTDASYIGMGYILAQEYDRQEHPISFGSHCTL